MHPIVRSIQSSQLKKVPQIQAGYTVRVSQKIKEGEKERIQRFEGLVIKVSHGEGVEKTFTVRKIVEGIGVEKIFPFHTPNITEIKVVKKAKVRRSKLYYMRERFGKSARLVERQVSDEERRKEMEMIEEAIAAQAKQQQEEKAEMNETAVEPEGNPQEAPVNEEVSEEVKTQEPAAEAAEEKAEQELVAEQVGETEEKKEAA